MFPNAATENYRIAPLYTFLSLNAKTPLSDCYLPVTFSIRVQVSKVTKLADKTIANTLTALKRKNYVIVEGKTLRLTDEGKAFLGPLAEKKGQGGTNEEVHKSLKEDMKTKEVELFDALLDGNIHDKHEVALALGYKDGKKTKTFMNMIGTLKSKQIVHYPEKDSIQLVHDTCFPWGSP